MPIPTAARVFWPSTVASIPANWSRDTAFDDRYLQGDGDSYTGPTNGGSTSHTHTGNSHTHQLASHTHQVSAAIFNAASVNLKAGTDKSASINRHNHVATPSGAMTSTPVSNATTPTIDAATPKPQSIIFIVIQPDDALQDIPDDAVCISDETSLPAGFTKYGPLDQRYIKTADTGLDGGGSTGTASHVHTKSAHTHTWATVDHTHDAVLSGPPSSTSLNVTGSGVSSRPNAHHFMQISTDNQGAIDNDTLDTGTFDNDPLFVKTLALRNTSGAATLPDGVIVPYTDTPVSVPSGWLYCDGSAGTPDLRDRQIKCTSTDGQVGDTGGVSTHAHDLAHTHTTASHTHTATDSDTGTVTGSFPPVIATVLSPANHNHTWTVSSESPATTGTGGTSSATDARYLYRTVVWIKKVAAAPAIFFGANF